MQQTVESNSDEDTERSPVFDHNNAKTLFTTDIKIDRPRMNKKNVDAHSNMFA